VALGLGWHAHVIGLSQAAAGTALAGTAAVESLGTTVVAAITFPDRATVEARIAGLAKIWTWAACGLIVLASWGAWQIRARTDVRLLAAAFAITFFGYFVVVSDQGHGWGYRYIHSAWFILPLFAALALDAMREHIEFRAMAAWALVLSLLFADGLRLTQVESFVNRHLQQVPPLATAPDPAIAELVFVDIRSGLYTQDLVQNDPFLRGSRMVMVSSGALSDAELVARSFPEYAKDSEGSWGSRWIKKH
jgi:hypothetical protein